MWVSKVLRLVLFHMIKRHRVVRVAELLDGICLAWLIHVRGLVWLTLLLCKLVGIHLVLSGIHWSRCIHSLWLGDLGLGLGDLNGNCWLLISIGDWFYVAD